jgi:hypothetical protein
MRHCGLELELDLELKLKNVVMRYLLDETEGVDSLVALLTALLTALIQLDGGLIIRVDALEPCVMSHV